MLRDYLVSVLKYGQDDEDDDDVVKRISYIIVIRMPLNVLSPLLLYRHDDDAGDYDGERGRTMFDLDIGLAVADDDCRRHDRHDDDDGDYDGERGRTMFDLDIGLAVADDDCRRHDRHDDDDGDYDGERGRTMFDLDIGLAAAAAAAADDDDCRRHDDDQCDGDPCHRRAVPHAVVAHN
jgi:hypothetical protein